MNNKSKFMDFDAMSDEQLDALNLVFHAEDGRRRYLGQNNVSERLQTLPKDVFASLWRLLNDERDKRLDVKLNADVAHVSEQGDAAQEAGLITPEQRVTYRAANFFKVCRLNAPESIRDYMFELLTRAYDRAREARK